MSDAVEKKVFELTPRELDILEKVRAIKAGDGLSFAELGHELGMPAGTLSNVLNGTYQGRVSEKIAEMEKGLLAYQEAKQAKAMLVKEPGFQATPSARTFMALMQHAQLMPTITMIAGGAGLGKTTAAKAFRRQSPNVVYFAANPAITSPLVMLGRISEIMGLEERVQSRYFQAIGTRVEMGGFLLIVDEAQFLPVKCLEMLRSLHDAFDLGICLIGNDQVHTRLEGGSRRPEFAQLFSRIAMKKLQREALVEDANMLTKAWGIYDPAILQFCRGVGKKPGALRNVKMMLGLASTLANGGDGQITLELVKAAWERLSTTDVSA